MDERIEQELAALRRAAHALAGAARVLFSTGAGMSADSGVPTYRDRHGRWRDFEAFTEKGITPSEIAHVAGYRSDPHLAWAFHEHIRRIMRAAQPHAGYGVITRWMRARWPDSFVLTTNVDDFHRRAGVEEHRLWERYGNIFEMQCLDGCSPEWWPEPRAPLTEIDEDTMRARDIPRCPFCGGPARPRMQMDHDEGFLSRQHAARRYERFLEAAPVDVYVVIGTTLWFSWPESVTERPRVIHVNPDPATHARYDDAIGLSMTAEDALLGLDFLLRRLDVGG